MKGNKRSSKCAVRPTHLDSGGGLIDDGGSSENGRESGSLGGRSDGILGRFRLGNDGCEKSKSDDASQRDTERLTSFLLLLKQSLDSARTGISVHSCFRNTKTNRSTTDGPLTFLAFSSSATASVTGAVASTSGSTTAAFSLATIQSQFLYSVSRDETTHESRRREQQSPR